MVHNNAELADATHPGLRMLNHQSASAAAERLLVGETTRLRRDFPAPCRASGEIRFISARIACTAFASKNPRPISVTGRPFTPNRGKRPVHKHHHYDAREQLKERQPALLAKALIEIRRRPERSSRIAIESRRAGAGKIGSAAGSWYMLYKIQPTSAMIEAASRASSARDAEPAMMLCEECPPTAITPMLGRAPESPPAELVFNQKFQLKAGLMIVLNHVSTMTTPKGDKYQQLLYLLKSGLPKP